MNLNDSESHSLNPSWTLDGPPLSGHRGFVPPPSHCPGQIESPAVHNYLRARSSGNHSPLKMFRIGHRPVLLQVVRRQPGFHQHPDEKQVQPRARGGSDGVYATRAMASPTALFCSLIAMPTSRWDRGSSGLKLFLRWVMETCQRHAQTIRAPSAPMSHLPQR
jgi:hypothetical protein